MQRTLTLLEQLTETPVNHAGSEYLRALWVRREAAMSAPFTVSEDVLFREEHERREQQAASATDES